MAILASTFVPSNSNLQGGIAGIAATVAVGVLTNSGYLALAAAAIGCPEATVAVVATGIIGAAASVAVSHISELQSMDSLIKAMQSVKTYSDPTDFPNPPPQKPSSNNLTQG